MANKGPKTLKGMINKEITNDGRKSASKAVIGGSGTTSKKSKR